jgi:hypothetical protein
MSLEIIIALVVTLPIFAFITGFIWYVNLGGAWSALKKAGRRNRPVTGSARLETEEA